MKVLEAKFVQDFITMCNDGWLQGWHERNGGNASYRIPEAEVESIREDLSFDTAWTPIGTDVPGLAGEFFLITGSGKFFQNVIRDPEASIAVIEVAENGSDYRIVWGLVNGLFIILGLWLDPVYAACRRALRIDESSRLWQAFQTLRTFVLVTFIKVLPEVGTLADGLGFWRQVFAARFWPGTENLVPGATAGHLVLTALAAELLFVTSLVQRRQPLTHWLARWPRWAHYLAVAVLALVTLYYAGAAAGTGGFLYAQF